MQDIVVIIITIIIIIIADTQVQDLQRLLVVRTLYEENIKFTLDQSSSLDD
jgi:hypothetical protein